MRRRRVKVRNISSRVLLSEVLPYEVPASFSNSGLYSFLASRGARFHKGSLYIEGQDDATLVVLRILFGQNQQYGKETIDGKQCYVIGEKALHAASVPLHFNIGHRERETRQLSIPHPGSQIAVAEFYSQYDCLVLLHSGKSAFSVRRPTKVARFTIVKDSLFGERLDRNRGGVEANGVEYDRLRSYFVYSRYDNIHKFHESTEYRESEKRFGYLLQLDVQKCFDSVYTHSIEWAIYGKQTVKASRSKHKATFAAHFDKVMHSLNDDETHGILIGPEVSRIFAELILQRVDCEVEERLAGLDLVHLRDYEILRYVDDYFIFMTDPGMRDVIVPVIEQELRGYRFHLNRSKESITSTPFISDLSIAKNALSRLIRKNLFLADLADPTSLVVEFKSSTHRLITAYKTSLRETGLGPLEVVNFTLAEVERRLESVIEFARTLNLEPSTSSALQNRRAVARLVLAAMEFSFYVYGGSPRVAPAVKLVRIASLCRKSAEELLSTLDVRHQLDDLIFREATTQLNRSPLSRSASVESLYLLTLLGELDAHYQVRPAELRRFLGVGSAKSGSPILPDWYHPLIVAEIMRYIGSTDEYTDLRLALEDWILGRIDQLRSSTRRTAEEAFLALNFLSSPSVSFETKWRILRLYGLKARADVPMVLGISEGWFTHWGEIDLHHELQLKRIQEVY